MNEFPTFRTNHWLEQYCGQPIIKTAHSAHRLFQQRTFIFFFFQESEFYNAYSAHEYFMITAWLCDRHHTCIYGTSESRMNTFLIQRGLNTFTVFNYSELKDFIECCVQEKSFSVAINMFHIQFLQVAHWAAYRDVIQSQLIFSPQIYLHIFKKLTYFTHIFLCRLYYLNLMNWKEKFKYLDFFIQPVLTVTVK